MKEAIAHFISGLSFIQGLALISVIFGLIILLIIVIGLFARISGVKKIDKDGIEFDDDGNPTPKKKTIRKVRK